MASGSAIRAGRAFVELFTKDAKLIKGLAMAGARVKAFGSFVSSWGQRIMLSGSAGLAAFGGMAMQFARSGDAIAKMSKRTGVSVEALSALSFAAEQSGSNVGALEKGLRKMSRTIVNAASGEKTYVDALKMAGVTVQELQGLSPEDQFKRIADGIAAIADPTLRSAAAQEIFGRSGAELIPLMAGGSKAIDALMREAQNLGLVMSGEDAAAAEEFTDAMNRLWRQVKMVTFQIGAAVAKAMGPFLDRAKAIVAKVIEWVKQNRELVATAFRVTAIITGIGAALTIAGGIITGVGFSLISLSAILSAVGAGFGFIITVIGAVLSPLGLVLTGLAGLGAYLLYVSGVGKTALGYLGNLFSWLKNVATQTFGGIANAIAAGDMKLAVTVLWSAIKYAWQVGVNWITGIWEEFKSWYHDSVTGIAMFFVSLSGSVQKIWATMLNWLSQTWEKFKTSSFTEGLANILAPIFAKISGVTTEEARKALSEDFSRARKAQPIQFALQDEELAKRKNEIDKETSAAHDVLAQEALRRNLARKRREEEAKAAAEQARKEWTDAIKRAQLAKALANNRMPGGPAAPGKPGKPTPIQAAGAIAKSQASGTFSAFAAAQFGSSSIGERTAKAAEEMNRRQAIANMRLDALVRLQERQAAAAFCTE